MIINALLIYYLGAVLILFNGDFFSLPVFLFSSFYFILLFLVLGGV